MGLENILEEVGNNVSNSYETLASLFDNLSSQDDKYKFDQYSEEQVEQLNKDVNNGEYKLPLQIAGFYAMQDMKNENYEMFNYFIGVAMQSFMKYAQSAGENLKPEDVEYLNALNVLKNNMETSYRHFNDQLNTNQDSNTGLEKILDDVKSNVEFSFDTLSSQLKDAKQIDNKYKIGQINTQEELNNKLTDISETVEKEIESGSADYKLPIELAGFYAMQEPTKENYAMFNYLIEFGMQSFMKYAQEVGENLKPEDVKYLNAINTLYNNMEISYRHFNEQLSDNKEPTYKID